MAPNNLNHVVFYTDTPLYGGAERAMLLLAKTLPKDRYKITLVCSNYASLLSWQEMWKDKGFKVLPLKVSHKHDPRHYFQLKKILLKLQPDIFHLHLWNPASCRYAFLAFYAVKKKLPTLRLITTEHDPFPLEGLKLKFKQWCLELTDHTVTVSQANYELLKTLYPRIKNKISTIYNAIDIEAWQQTLQQITQQQRDDFRLKTLHSNPGNMVFLTIATLHPRKGLRYLLEAFAHIVKKYTHAKLVIVGQGPEETDLLELIKNLDIDHNVMLQGYCENVQSYFASSDIFVLPSIKEAFGLVLLEAMVAGLPIIASKVGGIPEIIASKKNGLLVPLADSMALEKAMILLLKDKEMRKQMGEYNREDVKKFSPQVMGEKTAQLYEKLLHK